MRAIRFWLGVCFADRRIASMGDFPMNRSMRACWSSKSTLLLTYLLLCGCGGSDQHARQAVKLETSQAKGMTTPNGDEVGARSDAEQDALKRQRLTALSQELQAARAQQTTLMQRQAEMSAQIEARQEEGMALLATLKAQMQSQADAERSSAGDPEAFKKNARMQLEEALQQDDRLTTEFEALTSELRSVDSRVNELSAELDSLRASTENQ
jgi:chromosome segregation ATPase